MNAQLYSTLILARICLEKAFSCFLKLYKHGGITMPINLVIRNKRKELELTQEQIANYLGVSAPAVNKWEKGTSYPDISLLPPLARTLKIDLNTLLCFEESLTTHEIAQFSTQIIKNMEKNGYESGFHMANEKVKEYPNSGELIETMATILEGALFMYGAEIEHKEFYEEQILSFYERAAKCDDEKARNKAHYMLISKYIKKKEYEKAQQTLDLLPERSALDKKQLQAMLLQEQNQLDEAANILEQKLLRGINELQITIFSLVDVELKIGDDEKVEKLSNAFKEMISQFELWDYNAYVIPLQIAQKRKDVDESITILKSMLKTLMKPWTPKNSSLYNHMNYGESPSEEELHMKLDRFRTRMLSTLLSNLESSPDLEFLHSNKEFINLLKEYWDKCNKTERETRNMIK